VNENGLRVITNIPPAGNIAANPTVTEATNSSRPGKDSYAAGSMPDSKVTNENRILTAARKSAASADRIAAQADYAARGISPVPESEITSKPASIEALNANAYDALIVKYATSYKLEPALIRALIKAESNFNPRAVSSKGARGLMQLMPQTALRYGVRNIFDPEENIAAGVIYLSDLLEMFKGNIALALAAYNAGENLVARIKRIPPYPETQTYVAKIGRMFDFQRSPYLTPEVPSQPRIRMVRRSDGVLEITNLEPASTTLDQSN
jgi:soluble lytic murein transglycosylase-like protein